MAENITLTVENTTASDVSIDDMRKIISALTTITITETATFTEISQSDDLVSLINAGTIILGNGTVDYSIFEAIKVITPVSNLIFGAEFEIFQSLAESNTGASFVDKVEATTALKPKGTYRVGFYCDITNSDGTDIWKVQFLVNGAAIHQHTSGGNHYENKPDGNNDWSSESSVHYITLSSPATINLNITFGTNDNLARVSNATIEIWKVKE